MNAAAVALTVAKSATVKHKANTKHIQAGKERKKGMIAPLNVSKGQENKATSYRFGDDERELTAEEKEAYKMAGNIAEKIHYAGQAAAWKDRERRHDTKAGEKKNDVLHRQPFQAV